MQKRTRIALGAGILVIGMTALTGCASLTEPWNDAPVSTKDDSPAEIYSMPDGFANVATKCDSTVTESTARVLTPMVRARL